MTYSLITDGQTFWVRNPKKMLKIEFLNLQILSFQPHTANFQVRSASIQATTHTDRAMRSVDAALFTRHDLLRNH